MLIDDFNNARISNPFEVLGLQKVEGKPGFVLRAWLPSAKSVDVYSIDGKKKITSLNLVHQDGLFEAEVKAKNAFHYKFKVAYETDTIEIIDPYQFRDEAFYGLATMNEDPENIYKTLGAQLIEVEVDGVKYTASPDKEGSKNSYKKTAKVKYNPEYPNENLMASGWGGLLATGIVMEIIIAIIYIGIRRKLKGMSDMVDEAISEEISDTQGEE